MSVDLTNMWTSREISVWIIQHGHGIKNLLLCICTVPIADFANLTEVRSTQPNGTRTTLGGTLIKIPNSVVPQTWVIWLSSGSEANSSLTKQHGRSNRQLFSFCSAAYRGIEQADRMNYDFSRPFAPIFKIELTQEIEKIGHYYRIKGAGGSGDFGGIKKTITWSPIRLSNILIFMIPPFVGTQFDSQSSIVPPMYTLLVTTDPPLRSPWKPCDPPLKFSPSPAPWLMIFIFFWNPYLEGKQNSFSFS